MAAIYQITDAGIAAVNSAKSGGPMVNITHFAIGDAYGFTPVAGDTAIHGTIQYPQPGQTAVPSNYRVIDTDTVQYGISLPDTVGNFPIGNIGLFLDNGTLFALMALDSPVTKTASTPSAPGNYIELPFLLALDAIAPTINFSSIISNAAALASYTKADDLSPPGGSASNEFLITTKDEYGRSARMQEQDSDTWQASQFDWKVIGSGAVENASVYSLISVASIGTKLLMPTKAGRYMVRFTSGALKGQIRHVSALSAWAATTYYEQYQVIDGGNGHQYINTVAGTSGSGTPTFPTTQGGTVVDGGCTWQEYGVLGANSITWAGSTGTAAATGDTFDILRASSFTDFNRYVAEYDLQRRNRAFTLAHH